MKRLARPRRREVSNPGGLRPAGSRLAIEHGRKVAQSGRPALKAAGWRLGVRPATGRGAVNPTPLEVRSPLRLRGGRAGGPGSTATALGGGREPGGNRPSTEPPKPPPIMRAPAAPASFIVRTARSSSGTDDLVEVAQARVRGVEQIAQLAACRSASAATPRPRARSRRPRGALAGRAAPDSRAASSSVAWRSDGRPSSSGGARALSAALVVARCGVVVPGTGVQHGEASSRRGRAAPGSARAGDVDPQRRARRAEQRGELVEQPGARPHPLVLDA